MSIIKITQISGSESFTRWLVHSPLLPNLPRTASGGASGGPWERTREQPQENLRWPQEWPRTASGAALGGPRTALGRPLEWPRMVLGGAQMALDWPKVPKAGYGSQASDWPKVPKTGLRSQALVQGSQGGSPKAPKAGPSLSGARKTQGARKSKVNKSSGSDLGP